MSIPTDEARRKLEQQALRNVRGLVDRIEAGEAHDSRRQRRIFAFVVGIAVAVVATVIVVLLRHEAPPPVAIDPARLPPVQGGPPK